MTRRLDSEFATQKYHCTTINLDEKIRPYIYIYILGSYNL